VGIPITIETCARFLDILNAGLKEFGKLTWRSKQSLDFSFLMMYAKSRGTFYVQLEDDVLTKKGFVSIMKHFALEKIADKQAWFVIDFCQLGFIGKMFKSVELPWLVVLEHEENLDKPRQFN
jgi:alpha-1,3-mannosylglycoprotein beta-1,4-N-acetylglucosaminyltransferase A/B